MKPFTAGAALCFVFSLTSFAAPPTAPDFSNQTDKAIARVFTERERDWRNGAIVYQALVDRFAPSAKLEQEKCL
jgi:ABC-type spermidine/putrescine transport system permease subunit I